MSDHNEHACIRCGSLLHYDCAGPYIYTGAYVDGRPLLPPLGANAAAVSQPPPVGDGTPILPLVLRDLQDRAEHGRRKYGTVLRTKNGRDALKLKDVYGGLLKSLVFGTTIAAVSCAQGLRADGGPAGVGRATLRSVVISFILILVFGYLLTWMIW
jgi:hypothetical protein